MMVPFLRAPWLGIRASGRPIGTPGARYERWPWPRTRGVCAVYGQCMRRPYHPSALGRIMNPPRRWASRPAARDFHHNPLFHAKRRPPDRSDLRLVRPHRWLRLAGRLVDACQHGLPWRIGPHGLHGTRFGQLRRSDRTRPRGRGHAGCWKTCRLPPSRWARPRAPR